MANPRGGRMNNLMTLLQAAVSIADAAGDDQVWTVPAGFEWWIDLEACIALCTTTAVNDTTAGTITIDVAGTTVATYTVADGDAANSVFVFTPIASKRSGARIAAGETLTIASTLGSDSGTIAGVFDVSLLVEMNRL